MNKVAVLIGNNSETIAFSESGTLKVFLKQEKRWEVIDEITLLIDYAVGLRNAREKFLQIAKRLNDCSIIVGKKVDGIAYNTFEAMNFSIWEFDGKPETFLDYIIEKEKEYAMHGKEGNPDDAVLGQNQDTTGIKKMSSTHYVVDLEKLQSLNRSVSSKQILIPILEKREFKKLDILCTHIPPWLEGQIEKYQLKMETESLCLGSYKVSLIVN